MKDFLIIGYGVIGHLLSKEIEVLKPDIYDKYKEGVSTKVEGKHYDFAYICVDTPLVDENNPCDTSEVENAIKENDADIYILKSTIPVGYTDKLIEKTGKKIIFNPEFYGGTQHCNNFEFNYTVIGGDSSLATELIQELQKVYDARHQFKIVSTKLAETLKYMDNSWLATKVSFCGSFWEICNKNDINYEELRELFILDPRVNPAHTFIYADHPYWDSHCLNKDVPTIGYMQDNKFIKSVIDYNKYLKEEYRKE